MPLSRARAVLFNRRMSTRPGLPSESLRSILQDLDEAERETIELRLERWGDDLVAALAQLYPERDVTALALRLV